MHVNLDHGYEIFGQQKLTEFALFLSTEVTRQAKSLCEFHDFEMVVLVYASFVF